MEKLRKTLSLFVLCTILFCIFPLSAETKDPVVVATNSWTAAYARAAGVRNIVQLAPADMVHPPEYELRPSDIPKIKNADYIIYAGYEVLMKTVFDNFEKDEKQLIQIDTMYTPDKLSPAIQTIAEKCGNIKTAQRSAAEIEDFFATTHKRLTGKELSGKPVFAHFHQKAFAEALGFTVAGVFGPGPLKAQEIQKLGKLSPLLILDNAHNPLGEPLAETTGAPVAMLVNFPDFVSQDGSKSPDTLIGILNSNFSTILDSVESAE